MKRLLLTTALGLSLLASAAAVAADGYVVSNVTLRAGPDESYPSVGMLDAGATVVLDDCVSGWSWCDVGTPYGRGWVPGTYLQEDYQGQRVFVPEYGARIGIPFVAFDFNTYWASNYRDRPWYGERVHYSQFKPMYRPITIDINLHAQLSKGPAHDEHGRDDAWHDGHQGD
ncbi:MAG TPA: SH3 domain-containing protein, partial [Xanthomonadaceae bacterium]|nr:SH3 domain-containing protein [Xanthomonadaceae bacterium]